MSFLPVALLALAAGDSLPTPLIAVDGPQVAYTVAQYVELADSEVTAWRILGDWQPGAIIEDPSAGQVLIAFIPRAGEDQSTGVLTESPVADESGVTAIPASDGWCGRLFSIEWR